MESSPNMLFQQTPSLLKAFRRSTNKSKSQGRLVKANSWKAKEKRLVIVYNNWTAAWTSPKTDNASILKNVYIFRHPRKLSCWKIIFSGGFIRHFEFPLDWGSFYLIFRQLIADEPKNAFNNICATRMRKNTGARMLNINHAVWLVRPCCCVFGRKTPNLLIFGWRTLKIQKKTFA